ncbi:MAG: TolC family protein [Rhodocyclaceae bacterium]|nr:TolC family protein [Rhodocyclaceae bacterium]
MGRSTALLASLLIWALPATAAPLPEVVARVLETNPDVRSSAALLRAADAAVWQARSEFLPTLGVQRSMGSSRDRPAGALDYSDTQTRRSESYLRWTLFNGYADYYGNRSAEHSREAAGSDLEESREAIALRLTEIYVEVLRLTEQLRLAQDYVDDLRRLVRDVELRAEAGRIPPVEGDQAKSQLIAAESEQSQIRAQFAAASNTFRQVLGAPPEDLHVPRLNEALAEEPLDTLLARAEENSPRLKAARQRIAARDADVGAGTAGFLPRLSLETRKRISGTPADNLLSDQARSDALQLSLEIPLGGKNFARRWELVEKKLAAQADADAKALQLRTDLGEQYANLREARYMAPLLKDKTLASYKVVAAYRLQFAAGRRSLLDLLSVRDQLYQSLSQRNGNRYARIVATARLERLAGTLRLSLNPPK